METKEICRWPVYRTGAEDMGLYSRPVTPDISDRRGQKEGGTRFAGPRPCTMLPNALGKGMSFGVGEGELARKGDYDV